MLRFAVGMTASTYIGYEDANKIAATPTIEHSLPVLIRNIIPASIIVARYTLIY